MADMIALILASLYGLVMLWYLFVIVMAAKRARARDGGLPWPIWVLVAPALVLGFAVDIVLNCTLFTLLYLRAPNPRRLTVSARLKHSLKHDRGWRRHVAEWCDDHLIGPMAPDHLH